MTERVMGRMSTHLLENSSMCCLIILVQLMDYSKNYGFKTHYIRQRHVHTHTHTDIRQNIIDFLSHRICGSQMDWTED